RPRPGRSFRASGANCSTRCGARCARSTASTRSQRDLYKDDTPHVEVGGEVAEPFPGAGRVVGSTLPAGRVVTATHRGPWEQLDRGHGAVADYCERHGLRRIGPRWEIYGHATPVSAEQKVEISYLVG